MDTLKSLALLLALVAIATVTILLVASGADGKFEHTGLARVEAPREDVFEWLSQPERRAAWGADVVSSKMDTLDVEVGSKLTEVLGGPAGQRTRKLEVLEVQFGTRYAVRISEPGRTFDVQFRLSANQSAKRTRVDFQITGRFDAWWARVLEPFLTARLVKEIEADLARLDESLRKTT